MADTNPHTKATKMLKIAQVYCRILPAGDYVVLDPLYIFEADNWHRLVYELLRKKESVMVDYKGFRIFVWSTRAGDGIFPMLENGIPTADVATDNCILCVAPAALLSGRRDRDLLCGEYATTADMLVTCAGGDIRHGPFEIITSGRSFPGTTTSSTWAK